MLVLVLVPVVVVVVVVVLLLLLLLLSQCRCRLNSDRSRVEYVVNRRVLWTAPETAWFPMNIVSRLCNQLVAVGERKRACFWLLMAL